MFKNQAILALAVIGTAALAQAANYTPVGCFPSFESSANLGKSTFQSVGLCKTGCGSAGFPVFGLTNGTNCLCGNEADIPAAETKVEDALCDEPCPGFAPQNCGGDGFVSVFTSQTLVIQSSHRPSVAGEGVVFVFLGLVGAGQEVAHPVAFEAGRVASNQNHWGQPEPRVW
ncbi:hypothetical protein PG985_014829 [Apiospora marii]|uniref:WSC domain-containing protein n=1 Tax=Apiospora marii TaxID=335849 RepID=A0ABR1RJ55_9PEZI